MNLGQLIGVVVHEGKRCPAGGLSPPVTERIVGVALDCAAARVRDRGEPVEAIVSVGVGTGRAVDQLALADAIAHSIIGVVVLADGDAGAVAINELLEGVVAVIRVLGVHAVREPFLYQPARVVVGKGGVIVIRRPDAGEPPGGVVVVVGAIAVVVLHREQETGVGIGIAQGLVAAVVVHARDPVSVVVGVAVNHVLGLGLDDLADGVADIGDQVVGAAGAALEVTEGGLERVAAGRRGGSAEEVIAGG